MSIKVRTIVQSVTLLNYHVIAMTFVVKVLF